MAFPQFHLPLICLILKHLACFFTLGFFFLGRTRKNPLLFVLCYINLFFLNEAIMLHLHCLFNWNFLFLFVYQIPVTHASVDFSYLLMYLCVCVCVYLCLIPKPRLNETVTDIPSPRAYLKTIIFFFEKVTLRIAIFEKVPCYENFNRLATTL